MSCPKVLDRPDTNPVAVNDASELAESSGTGLVLHGATPAEGFVCVTVRIFVSYAGQGALSDVQVGGLLVLTVLLE